MLNTMSHKDFYVAPDAGYIWMQPQLCIATSGNLEDMPENLIIKEDF